MSCPSSAVASWGQHWRPPKAARPIARAATMVDIERARFLPPGGITPAGHEWPPGWRECGAAACGRGDTRLSPKHGTCDHVGKPTPDGGFRGREGLSVGPGLGNTGHRSIDRLVRFPQERSTHAVPPRGTRSPDPWLASSTVRGRPSQTGPMVLPQSAGSMCACNTMTPEAANESAARMCDFIADGEHTVNMAHNMFVYLDDATCCWMVQCTLYFVRTSDPLNDPPQALPVGDTDLIAFGYQIQEPLQLSGGCSGCTGGGGGGGGAGGGGMVGSGDCTLADIFLASEGDPCYDGFFTSWFDDESERSWDAEHAESPTDG